jgi:hypothetical protein
MMTMRTEMTAIRAGTLCGIDATAAALGVGAMVDSDRAVAVVDTIADGACSVARALSARARWAWGRAASKEAIGASQETFVQR